MVRKPYAWGVSCTNSIGEVTVPSMGNPPVAMFMAGKEERLKLTLAEHCRTYDVTIIRTDGLYKAHEKVQFRVTIGRRQLTHRPKM